MDGGIGSTGSVHVTKATQERPAEDELILDPVAAATQATHNGQA
jgi:hypothetical protein